MSIPSLSPHVLKRLEERRKRRHIMHRPMRKNLFETTPPDDWLSKLSGNVYKRFLESGMTDDELGEELERAKHEMRAERRARSDAEELSPGRGGR